MRSRGSEVHHKRVLVNKNKDFDIPRPKTGKGMVTPPGNRKLESLLFPGSTNADWVVSRYHGGRLGALGQSG